jgi:tritrans,polycis-undecaprenyl-diphosphate synthase [geranylgeranyl-diphosphate specific]
VANGIPVSGGTKDTGNGNRSNGSDPKKRQNGKRSSSASYGTISRVITSTMYSTYERKLLQEIRRFPVPGHIAIIMDGNRRFAEKIGLSRAEGHERGKDKVNDVLDWSMDIGVKIVTVFALSSENFSRSNMEVVELMNLFERAFREAGDDEKVHKNHIRIHAIGNLKNLPNQVRDAIRYAEDRTKEYSDYFYNVAVSYGGRQEIIQAIRKIGSEIKDGTIEVSDINEELVSSYLYTADFPDPDLILRTSGEERISNFLLWQLAYSELYFTDVYWPEFRKIDFLRAIRSYQKRKRKYGV